MLAAMLNHTRRRLTLVLASLALAGCSADMPSIPVSGPSASGPAPHQNTPPAEPAAAPALSVAFTGEAPQPAREGDIVTYYVTAQHVSAAGVVFGWDVSDGSAHVETSAGVLNHRYTRAGTYVVAVAAVDGNGAVAHNTTSTTVLPREHPSPPSTKPPAALSFFITCAAGKAGALSVCDVAPFYDSGGVSAADVSTTTWSWGDGTADSTFASSRGTHTYASAGTRSIRVSGTATTPDGVKSAVALTSITIVP